MGRALAFLYGLISYVIFFATLLYAIGFVGNLVVPKSIDSGHVGPVGQALIVNILILALFAVQHSVMARQGFKDWWTKIVPQPVERATYVLLSSLILILLFWQWRPMAGEIWSVDNAYGRGVLVTLYFAGWVILILATFNIGHFDLFGLNQVYCYLRGKERGPNVFKTPGLYRAVRHPIMLGWIIIFWATPRMTVGHLVFAAVTTAYIFIGIKIEERDLVGWFGEAYEDYRRKVPMVVPFLKGTQSTPPDPPPAPPPDQPGGGV
ncbi:MAG: isoprenylcysteine carboxylmethyltransferase family protein [Alphaproteobacteria bacterium]|nr:isoprenylcysteine carboxylmethyltransferase family protein [Alphaproteobacteria bacterium]MCZ6744875.1 isoprenylcysteine carboxylmethyltransferase family protein [Alphaproteobacteria bacterium]